MHTNNYIENLIGALVPIIYLAMLAVERRYTARKFEPIRRWQLQGIAFLIVVLAIGSLTPLLLPLTWFREHALASLQGAAWAEIPTGLLVSSFVGYWFHRAEHRFTWLWRASHQMHHSPSSVDIAGAFFTHPIEVLLKVSISTTVCILLLGLGPLQTSVVGLIGAMLSLFAHWNINTPHWLGYLIPRPESHILHHARDRPARNYADLPIWDLLFGTFENPRSAWQGKVGFQTNADSGFWAMVLMRNAEK
jgi:sterol desaturase/sphingolipid hydroxylase (fatty acid hydroxylase superfamily)